MRGLHIFGCALLGGGVCGGFGYWLSSSSSLLGLLLGAVAGIGLGICLSIENQLRRD